jgi:hypothetical protein
VTAYETAIIWGNLLGCLFAIAANACAARVGFLIHRGLAATIAIIGVVYVIGYALLLTGSIELLRWSAFFRGVSLIVWPVVWAGPAIISIAAWRHAHSEIAKATRAMEPNSDRPDLRR